MAYKRISPIPVIEGGTGAITLTNHGILLGQSTSAIVATAVGATNTVLLGNTGADPSFGTVPNAALTNSSVTLNNGNNISVTGSPLSLGGTASFDLTGTTNNAVQIGNAGGSLTSLGVGTNGQVLLGATGAAPAFATLTSTGSTITYTLGVNSLNIDGTDASTTQKGVVELADNAETIAGTDTVRAITPDDLKAKLGTQTNHGVLVGAGTAAAVTALAVGTNGQLLIGSTGADPAFATVTSGDSSVTFATGAATLGFTVTQATTAQLGGATFATTAEVTTGTSTTEFPSVASMIGHEGIVKAWVKHSMTGTFADGFNISSVTDTGTGAATVNFTTSFANTNYCAVVTAQDASSGTTAMVDTFSTGSILVEYRNASTTLNINTLTDPTNGMVICIGDR